MVYLSKVKLWGLFSKNLVEEVEDYSSKLSAQSFYNQLNLPFRKSLEPHLLNSCNFGTL